MSIDGKGSYDIGGGSVPVDKFRLIYLIFGWLGIGTLLPWNMFITVSAYWTDKWKTVDTGTLAHNASDTLGGKYSSDYRLQWYLDYYILLVCKPYVNEVSLSQDYLP